MKNKINIKKKIVLVIVVCIAIVATAFVIENIYIRFNTTDQYMITTDNFFDYQGYNQCSGYSSAYVLRSLGEEADGLGLYKEIDGKNKDGTVPPKNLVKFLNKKGYSAKYVRGNMRYLKHEISKGTPVIAYVKVSPENEYTHYLPIVGYDDENFYTADSLLYKKNSDDENYNRVILKSDFEQMWDAEFFRKNTYIKIKLK